MWWCWRRTEFGNGTEKIEWQRSLLGRGEAISGIRGLAVVSESESAAASREDQKKRRAAKAKKRDW